MATLKLKASSLLESLIALVILLFVLSVGTYIYVTMLSTSISFKQLQAESILQKEAILLDLSKPLPNDIIVREGISLSRQCTAVKDHEKLVLILLKAFDEQGKELAEYKAYRIVNLTNETP